VFSSLKRSTPRYSARRSAASGCTPSGRGRAPGGRSGRRQMSKSPKDSLKRIKGL
jgi:hypothetical protein